MEPGQKTPDVSVMGKSASDPLDDLAPLFSQRRSELGLSLREVSTQCGVPVATLSRVEQGRTPDLATFRRIVEWLGLPSERFLNPTTRSVNTPEVISEAPAGVRTRPLPLRLLVVFLQLTWGKKTDLSMRALYFSAIPIIESSSESDSRCGCSPKSISLECLAL